MKISEVVDSAYTFLLSNCRNNNVISEGRTAEDILNDIVLQGLRKYKNSDTTWENAFKYLKDNFFLELHFSPKRRGKEMVLLSEDCLKNADLEKIAEKEPPE